MAARVPGFEPGSKVLETSILPLNYTRLDVNSHWPLVDGNDTKDR